MNISQLYVGIKTIYDRDKEFPSVEKINQETGVKTSAIEDALQFFLSKGKLNYVNGSYVFPKSNKKKINLISTLRIIMGIVGVSCIVCSIRFTDVFNRLTMPRLWAFILSSSIVIFNSFCFTAREYLKSFGKKFQANLFIFLYIIGVSYSIFTAIAGQYNDYLLNDKITIENKNEELSNNKKYELLSQQKERYLEQIETYKKQVITQQKIIDNLSESPERKFEYNNTWKQTNQNIDNFNNKIEELENKISEIDKELISSTHTKSNNSKNIFDWIAELFGISSDLLQFIISLFPAVFIDLISPFAIMFAFSKNN